MSFCHSGLDNFAFDFECPVPESMLADQDVSTLDDIPFDDSLTSIAYSNALLDGLEAPTPAAPEVCVSLRKPSAPKWIPLNQLLPSPIPTQSPLVSSKQQAPSRWVAISPPNVPSRVQSPYVQYLYPPLSPYSGGPQQLVNTVPYHSSPSPYLPVPNNSLQGSPFSSPHGPFPFQTPTVGAQYRPIPPFPDENAPNSEDLALSPVGADIGGIYTTVVAPASVTTPASITQPTRKRRSVHESDFESSGTDSELSLAPSDKDLSSLARKDSVFTGRKARVRATKRGPPYKYQQTEARKKRNEKRKADYQYSKQDLESSEDEYYSASELLQTGHKKGRPYELPQTKERQEKNAQRRRQYQNIKENSTAKHKAKQASESHYENVRKYTRKQMKLMKEIENTKEFADAQDDDAVDQGSDSGYIPRTTRSQAGKRARLA